MSRARWNVQYHQRVLATDPIAYWALDEKQGAIAYDRVSGRVAGAQNGTHVGVILGQPGIGDGRTGPLYDGANDYSNIYTVSFRDAFNPSQGSLLIWARVSSAGVWVDGVARNPMRLQADANNRIVISTTGVANTMAAQYIAGGVTMSVTDATFAGVIDFFSIMLTWDKPADQFRLFFDGVQSGVTQNGLGVWVGNLVNTATTIGARSTAPASVWDGTLGHCAIWDHALSLAEALSLGAL